MRDDKKDAARYRWLLKRLDFKKAGRIGDESYWGLHFGDTMPFSVPCGETPGRNVGEAIDMAIAKEFVNGLCEKDSGAEKAEGEEAKGRAREEKPIGPPCEIVKEDRE